jgi:hypothetical protein
LARRHIPRALALIALFALAGCGGSHEPQKESGSAALNANCYNDPAACPDQSCSDKIQTCLDANLELCCAGDACWCEAPGDGILGGSCGKMCGPPGSMTQSGGGP